MGNKNPELHLENLKPFNKSNVEKARKAGKKGGKKSQEVQKEKKEEEKQRVLFKDLFIELSTTQFTEDSDPTKKKIIFPYLKKLFPNKSESDFNHMLTMYSSLYRTALGGGKGSVQAFNAIRDTMGEKPIDKQEMNQVNYNIDLNKKDLKKATGNLKRMLEDNNFED